MAKAPSKSSSKMSAAQKAAATRKKNAKSKGDAPTVAGPASSDKNVMVRKIDNGFVVRQTQMKGGKYIERETYTPVEPKITINKAPKAADT